MSETKLKISQLPATTAFGATDRLLISVPIGRGVFVNKIITKTDFIAALGSIGGASTLDDLMSFEELTGGGDALDAVEVTSADVPTYRMGYDSTYGVGTFRARVGSEATSLPNFVRPTTYTGSSPNNVGWEKV